MAASYSLDLREKVIRAYEQGRGSQRALAKVFGVSRQFVEQLWGRYRSTGEFAPKPHGGGQRSRLDAPTEALLRQWVGEQPDATLEELCERLHAATGIGVSPSRLCRVLKHLDLPRKKKSLHASERDTERVRQARGDYQARIAALEACRFKFIDESGVNLAMTRHFGRAPKGARVLDSVPQNYGTNITLLGALSVQGMEAVMSIEGATDGAVFRAYLEQVLCPTLAPGDVVVMDNLSAHKSAAVSALIEARGARLIYLSPYSPDFSPIELCWSKLKTALRRAKARTREALEVALVEALETISPSDARNWFAHCGYALQS